MRLLCACHIYHFIYLTLNLTNLCILWMQVGTHTVKEAFPFGLVASMSRMNNKTVIHTIKKCIP